MNLKEHISIDMLISLRTLQMQACIFPSVRLTHITYFFPSRAVDVNTSSPLLLSSMVPNNPSKLNAMVSIFFCFCFLLSQMWRTQLQHSRREPKSQQTTNSNKRNKQRSQVVHQCSGCETESIARHSTKSVSKSSRNHATPNYRAAIIMASFHPNASPFTSCKCMGTYKTLCAINEASW